MLKLNVLQHPSISPTKFHNYCGRMPCTFQCQSSSISLLTSTITKPSDCECLLFSRRLLASQSSPCKAASAPTSLDRIFKHLRSAPWSCCPWELDSLRKKIPSVLKYPKTQECKLIRYKMLAYQTCLLVLVFQASQENRTSSLM